MRLNAVLDLQFDVPAVTGETQEDKDRAVAAVRAALAMDLLDLVELETPGEYDTEVSFTINLDGSPVEA